VTRSQLMLLQVANLAVSGTGLVYAWMRYLVTPTEEWAVVNHPWQPHIQHLHVLAAPLLVFAVGLIWSGHIAAKLRNGSHNRVAGIGLTALFLPMAASGYLVQVAVSEPWRERWIWVHVAASLLWIAFFVAHQARAWIKRTQSGTEASAPVITAVQFGSPSPGSGGVESTGRQRIRSISSGTSSPNRAPSTSKAAGGEP
jgi:hypothetical protein